MVTIEKIEETEPVPHEWYLKGWSKKYQGNHMKKEKMTKVKFKGYNKWCNVPSKKNRSAPKELATVNWIDYHPSFQYPYKIFESFPNHLRQHIW